MKRTFSLKIVAPVMLLLLIVSMTNAQTIVLNTKTRHATGASTGNQVVLPPVSIPSGSIVNVNNGWNGTSMISSIGASGSDYYGQAFIANVAVITRIGIVIQETSPEGQVRFGIAADNGGVPNYAAPLYMGSLKNPTPTAQWYYEVGLNIPVTVGQKYYVFIDGYDNAGATGQAAIGYSATQPMAGEGIVFSNDEGGSWDKNYTQYPLAIYVEGLPALVPVPIWAIVLAFVVIGVSAFIGIRRKMAKQAI
jgi:hypothetical protein